ncbi:MAG: glycosyltransferase family 39 protein [Chloroflexota bacterium]
MTATNSIPRWVDWFLGLALVGLALWLRTTNLIHFITADEHNWVYRSTLFLNALLARDWASTETWLTPGVTTTWLGSISLQVYYQLNADTIAQPLPDWLTTFSKNKIDLDILYLMRWSVALFSALMTGVIYGLARQIWTWPVALLGSLILVTEPHLLAVSRIIGHDVLVTNLMIASLFSFLIAAQLNGKGSHAIRFRWIIISGIFAGLAILSKAVALFLGPFVIVFALIDIGQKHRRIQDWLWPLLMWGGVLCGTFILVWPAAWLNPIGLSWALVENAFLSSAGLEDPDIQPFWAVPDLGIGYYLVNGAFKISPALMIGGILMILHLWQYRRNFSRTQLFTTRSAFLWLCIFAIGFTLMMTLGVKKSPRYILPIYPAIVFIAAGGWLSLLKRFKPVFVIMALAVISLGITLQYAPYYYTYLNPLLGGSLTGPQIVRIGWGEGLDNLARWLNNQPDINTHHLGVRYTATIYPFFEGEISSPVSEELDYVAFYIKQSQSGYPTPEILQYFGTKTPLHEVIVNGVNYAQVYEGPAMVPIDIEATETSPSDLPLAYRPSTIYAPIGENFTIDLLWPATDHNNADLTGINIRLENDAHSGMLSTTGFRREDASGIWVSQHTFDLPLDLPRGIYQLWFNDSQIGQIKARRLHLPHDFQTVSLDLNNQVRLTGFKSEQHDQHLRIDLAWQGWPKANNDYTAFIQVLNAQGERVAGVDVAPEWGFTNLDRKEIRLVSYSIPLSETMQPGSYSLLVGLYYFAGQDLINVGSVTLENIVDVP